MIGGVLRAPAAPVEPSVDDEVTTERPRPRPESTRVATIDDFKPKK